MIKYYIAILPFLAMLAITAIAATSVLAGDSPKPSKTRDSSSSPTGRAPSNKGVCDSNPTLPGC